MSHLGYLVDTDWVIDHLNQINRVMVRLSQARKDGLGISVISLAELWHGIYFSRDPRLGEAKLAQFLAGVAILGVSEETSKRFGRLRGTLQQEGRPIPDFDLMIAATALEHDLTLLWNNRRHFLNIPGLRLESI
jgi:tRNA(fMet)-specific endonuclease VapC